MGGECREGLRRWLGLGWKNASRGLTGDGRNHTKYVQYRHVEYVVLQYRHVEYVVLVVPGGIEDGVLGYVVYSGEEAGAEAGKYKNNRALLRARAQAGLAVLQQHELTDPRRVAAIGYCFGGTAVIELARSGADIAGVVSFHGGLDSPQPADGRNIKCKVLALHGADDPHVSAKDLAAFEDEMRQAKVDWQLVKYGGAVHSFTDWNAGDNPRQGAAYNERADRRSWEAMKQFFAELFK